MLYLKNEDNVDSLNYDISTIMKRRICETDNIILQPYSSNAIIVNTPVLSNYSRTIYTIELRNASSSGIHVSNCWVTSGSYRSNDPKFKAYVSNGGNSIAKILVQVLMLYVRSDIKIT